MRSVARCGVWAGVGREAARRPARVAACAACAKRAALSHQQHGVVAQHAARGGDGRLTPACWRTLSLTFAAQGYNVEVALVDTEGETAVDVFYLTRDGGKLSASEAESLLFGLAEAVRQNVAR